MPINDMQLLSGYFFKAYYYEYVEKTGTYKDPIEFRFKQNDEGTQGVSAGSKQSGLKQDMRGRQRTSYKFTIKTIASLPFKPKDNIQIVTENRKYTIKNTYESYATVNSIANLQFPTMQENRPIVLELGDV